jgi:phosphoglycerate dehydrogenase-like enzyme
MDRILVTPRSVTQHGHPSLRRLAAAGYELALGPPGRQPTEAELLDALPGCVGYIAGVEPVSARVLTSASKLRAISRNGTGTDNIDAATAASRGIAVLRAEGANARGVAELTFALIFALVRDLSQTDAALKRDQWVRRQGIELEGRTLGLIGCGRVGRIVASIAGALGMKVLASDPLAEGKFQPGDFFRFGPVNEIFRQAEVISLHCPPVPDGRPILDRDALASSRRGVFVVNTARFDLIDPAAMLVGLDSGHVAGLGLDVFAEEPPKDTTLARHSRVIATSHLGGFTQESVERAMDAAVDNLLRALAVPHAKREVS